MKRELFFVHSAGPQGLHQGSDHLVKYLRRSLGEDYNLHNPAMPAPENPRYVDWKMTLQATLPIGGNDVAIIGHSLGGSVIVKYITEGLLQLPLAGLFLVGSPFWGSRGWSFDEFKLPGNFVEKLPAIGRTFIYHSRNDRWVPFSHAALYASSIPNSTMRRINGSEHEFAKGLPELVRDIRELNL